MHPSVSEPLSSTRRRWVKQYMLGIATLTGPPWVGTVLSEVTSTGPGSAVIRLKASDVRIHVTVSAFNPNTGTDETTSYQVAALAAPGGSVQYQFSSAPPFTLNRVEANRFVTLNSICTHNGCTVPRFKKHIVGQDSSVPPVPITRAYIECPCHGSRYDIEGRVFRDGSGNSTEPAQFDLARFETSYDAATDIVCITIPDLKLHINSIRMQAHGPGESVRLKLDFPVTAFTRYEIRYQANLNGPLTVVPFSTTPGGAANQTSVFTTLLTHPPDGNFTAYVDSTGSKGFFAVGLVLGDVASEDEVPP